MTSHDLTMAFLLGLLLALHALRDYSVYAQAFTQGDGLHETRESDLFVQKEVLDGSPSGNTWKIGFRGRKMGGLQVPKNEIKRKKWLIGESYSGINTGISRDASKKFLGGKKAQSSHQGDINTMKQSYFPEIKPKQSRNFRTKKWSKFYLTSDHKKVSGEAIDSVQEDETRRLLEATREIVSLMHKDYKGFGRRKPPINNHVPLH